MGKVGARCLVITRVALCAPVIKKTNAYGRLIRHNSSRLVRDNFNKDAEAHANTENKPEHLFPWEISYRSLMNCENQPERSRRLFNLRELLDGGLFPCNEINMQIIRSAYRRCVRCPLKNSGDRSVLGVLLVYYLLFSRR